MTAMTGRARLVLQHVEGIVRDATGVGEGRPLWQLCRRQLILQAVGPLLMGTGVVHAQAVKA